MAEATILLTASLLFSHSLRLVRFGGVLPATALHATFFVSCTYLHTYICSYSNKIHVSILKTQAPVPTQHPVQ